MDSEKQGIMSNFLSGAGLAAVQGAIDVGVSAFNNNLAEKSAQKQYERQLEFWHKQNKYNSPLAQRQRFQQAGMNPASATGQMATSGTAQGLSSVPGNEYAQQGALKLDGFVNVLETIARIEKLGAETGLATSQIATEGIRQILLGLDIPQKKVDYLLSQYEAEAKRIDVENLPEFFRHRNIMYDLDENYRQAEIDYQDALKSLAEAQTDESKASAQKLVAETGLVEIKADTERSMQALNYASAQKIKFEDYKNRILAPIEKRALTIANELNKSQKDKADAEKDKAEIEAALKRVELEANTKDGTVDEANAWYYINQSLSAVSGILGVAVGAVLGKGAGNMGKTSLDRDPDINPDYSTWR